MAITHYHKFIINAFLPRLITVHSMAFLHSYAILYLNIVQEGMHGVKQIFNGF